MKTLMRIIVPSITLQLILSFIMLADVSIFK